MQLQLTQRACFAIFGLLALTAALAPMPADASGTDEGKAFRLDDGALVYREVHMLYDSSGDPSRLVLYRCPDGSLFARKSVVERAGAATPDFDFVDGRSGYREGVRTNKGKREVYWQKSSTAGEKSKLLDVPAGAVIDAGFDAMVREQWSRLATKNGITAQFLLPSALRFLKVSIQRMQGVPEKGVTSLRMKLDTWYGFAAPDTELDYRSSDHRLLRFKGIGTIHDDRGRNQAVRIEFPGGLEGRRASASEIAAARRLPLTGRCKG
ncbi:MAG: hypothetical protein ABIQ62_01045 [Thermomonas sp.]